TVSTEGATRGLSGLGAEQMAATEAAILARQPLGRVGTPDDIATVVAFLASGAAGFITGDTVLADGGMLLL
ncbi:MAG: 2-deoxy-D-gluconate 3-dehydrogenase, partial [Acidimicrobiia bacterium]|nr:2-deoxy-D-gluconate 3-dehydrogenase [Acidimicrobiia bacterium]